MAEVSVILPTFNEAGTIRQAVGGLKHELASRDHEIVVIDDNSPDGTATLVLRRWSDDPTVKCYVRRDAAGLASAVVDGMDHASGEVYGVMDADLQHPTTAMTKLLLAIDDGADLAVGSRHVAAGSVEADWPLRRQVTSWGAQLLAWLAIPRAREIHDPMSGLFAVRADCVDPVLDRLRPRGYKILLELLARCPIDDVVERGYAFKERQAGASNLGLREYVRYVEHLGRLSLPARLPDRDLAVPQERDAEW